MKSELYNYDIFPMVFPAGEPVEITVKPLGCHSAFPDDVTVRVQRLDSGTAGREFTAWNKTDYTGAKCEDGALRFTYTAESEGELFVRVLNNEGRRILQMSVYALADDMADRIPLKGDLHMHTCRSDGREDPCTVAANYRKIGYDFAVITDHRRYYPSLEAVKKYSGADIPLNIIPGEEVHLPFTDVHIVNAGGLFSVNGLLETGANYAETNGSDEGRYFDENAPRHPVLTDEEYEKEIEEIEARYPDFPENVEKRSYAVCVWAFERIREAGGLGIFAHPYWIADMWHVTEPFTRYMMKNHPFDAFEVLGGENYYEQNGFQAALYYDEYREGRIHPIVGSTDTHGSTEHNRNSDICSTIVFAHANERADIIQSIKDKYSIAVDSISKEYRLVGEFRFQKYASFLMENYFPVHDRQAALDGEIMRQYYVGDATADEMNAVTPKAQKLIDKYIRRK